MIGQIVTRGFGENSVIVTRGYGDYCHGAAPTARTVIYGTEFEQTACACFEAEIIDGECEGS